MATYRERACLKLPHLIQVLAYARSNDDHILSLITSLERSSIKQEWKGETFSLSLKLNLEQVFFQEERTKINFTNNNHNNHAPSMADPITLTVVLGVAVTVFVVDECYKAYQRRKIRKEVERQLGITPADRREIRRLWREIERERRASEKERRKRLRQRQRDIDNGIWFGEEEDGEPLLPDEFSEAAGRGLPEYSLRPREGVDRALIEDVITTMSGQKKKGLRDLFLKIKKRQNDEAELVAVDGGERSQQKKRWFKKKNKARRVDEQSSSLADPEPGEGGAPPSYESIASEIEDELITQTSIPA